MNCQVVNFQRCEHTYIWSQQGTGSCAMGVRHEWNRSSPSVSRCWRSSSSTSSHLRQSVSACPFTRCQGTGLLQRYFSRYCTVRLKVISLFFVLVFYVLFVLKYYKPRTVQYCTVNCISWVPRLTSLERTNRTYECSLRMELVCMQGIYCTVIILQMK